MNISLSFDAGDFLCKSTHFTGLFTITNLEDLNSLKTSLTRNIANVANHVYRINGKLINGQWMSTDTSPIDASLMPPEGSCAAVSSDGINFSVKSVDCSTPLKIICGHGISYVDVSTLETTTANSIDIVTFPTPFVPTSQPNQISTDSSALVSTFPTSLTPPQVMIPTLPPIVNPTSAPSDASTLGPSQPTSEPSLQPTFMPSEPPIMAPTLPPSSQPPTEKPTIIPTSATTLVPSLPPSESPIKPPTIIPDLPPSPFQPPTEMPTIIQTSAPTVVPTILPTEIPTSAPTEILTSVVPPAPPPPEAPTSAPTLVPTIPPTEVPTLAPITTTINPLSFFPNSQSQTAATFASTVTTVAQASTQLDNVAQVNKDTIISLDSAIDNYVKMPWPRQPENSVVDPGLSTQIQTPASTPPATASVVNSLGSSITQAAVKNVEIQNLNAQISNTLTDINLRFASVNSAIKIR